MSTNLIEHPTAVPSRKIALGVGGGGGGAVVLVWAWNGMVVPWLGLPEMPAEVAAPIVLGVAFAVGYLVREWRRPMGA